MTAADLPALNGFSAVDIEPDARALIAALDEQASIPAIQRLRAVATELLGVRIGHRLVDVGCGTGDVARALAGIVGPIGSVLGIDASETMLSEARRRAGATSLPVEFSLGDINSLALPDEHHDGTLCERVFQHLTDPHAAMAELVRITRSHGRIVVIDTDWGLHGIHGADPDLTATIVDAWMNNAANGHAGRRLPAIFTDAGIQEVTVHVDTITSTDPQRPARPPFTTMAASAVRTGAIAHTEADTWLDTLADAGRRGHFFWAVTVFAVAGTRP